jgi:cystathionine beta-lyase/cystathionine gamma-synthase
VDYEGRTHPCSHYARSGNPTVQVLEVVLADLEGGESALAFSSGMAAISTTLLALLEPGDHVVAGKSLYSDTTRVLTRLDQRPDPDQQAHRVHPARHDRLLPASPRHSGSGWQEEMTNLVFVTDLQWQLDW